MPIPSLKSSSDSKPQEKPSLTKKTAKELVDGEAKQQTPDKHDIGGFFFEILKMGVICALLFVGIRFYVIKPFVVQGQSMFPTFETKEYLIVDEISYRFKEPVRGDVVVFKYPPDPEQFFIKRIIGLPGEQVKCESESITIVNAEFPEGIQIPEAYLSPETKTQCQQTSTLVPEGHYYVLGDNRGASLDSRRFGPLEDSNVVGKVMLRGWPAHRAGFIKTPEYQ
ncbi:MAG: signal peptidase I [Candidatus Jacksonbacteria bacterium]|jgi:signal peptidase I|nr:signal peptidase I [Candidatus Jacksonbacteria bacterium]MBT6034676.1 signal peptidase I [Candidatus Jacksonbacteria bacterium]MBT6300937.1 signal peptidase I [Candidatus Jacksonbacteria bacterium]MBT6756962.1 signal peptidase I [Candidatus Jacksonbacteria bacterium]MBT6955181.1 signal peptidase I [Candidatus Jacksonbacteria bacterium]